MSPRSGARRRPGRSGRAGRRSPRLAPAGMAARNPAWRRRIPGRPALIPATAGPGAGPFPAAVNREAISMVSRRRAQGGVAADRPLSDSEVRHARFRHPRWRPHPDRQAVRRLRRLQRHGPGGLRHRRRPGAGRGQARGRRLRLYGPGPAGGPGPDHRSPGGHQGRRPHDGPGDHGEQGLPVRAEQHLPGRPDDPGGRGRHRGGRGHGVHDQGPLPARRGPRRLPARRRRARRLDDVRRP